MKLLPNEERIIASNSDKIVLTNYRIQFSESESGKSSTTGIFLENISSFETKYRSNTFWIILGIISVLVGIYLGSQNRGGGQESLAAFFVAALFFCFWWFSRKNTVTISSNGGAKINFLVSSMSTDQISDFIHRVALAKQTRMNQLYSGTTEKFSIAQGVS